MRSIARCWVVASAVLLPVLAGCGDSEADPEASVGDDSTEDTDAGDDSTEDTDTSGGADDTDAGDDTEGADDTDAGDDTEGADDTDAGDDTSASDPEPAGPPLVQDGDVWTIDWDAVTPVFVPANESSADPLYNIHTTPGTDGFYFGLELYTTGYGALWTGETGTFDVICNEPAPGPNSTGICPKFDPDLSGGIAGFEATGSITIDRLDASGYDITVHSVTLTDGTTIGEFTLTG